MLKLGSEVPGVCTERRTGHGDKPGSCCCKNAVLVPRLCQLCTCVGLREGSAVLQEQLGTAAGGSGWLSGANVVSNDQSGCLAS